MSSEVTAFILVEFGQTNYGISALEIQEIAEVELITPVPDSESHLLGVTHYHGQPTPVLELGALLGQKETAEGDAGRLIFLDVLDHPVALKVARTREFLEIKNEEIKAAPAGGKGLAFVHQIAQSDGRLVLILDSLQLLEHTLGVNKP